MVREAARRADIERLDRRAKMRLVDGGARRDAA
jgi:hypothetical protein